VVKNIDAAGLRIARLAYVMHYVLDARVHMMCTRLLFARLVGSRDAHFTTAHTAYARAWEKYLARTHTLRQSHTIRKIQCEQRANGRLRLETRNNRSVLQP